MYIKISYYLAAKNVSTRKQSRSLFIYNHYPTEINTVKMTMNTYFFSEISPIAMHIN